MSKVLDIHPHIITTDEARYPRDPLGGNQSVWSKERPTTTEQMLVAMDEAGIAKAALVQASTCYGFDNSYVADAVAEHPDRFTGVFSVDMLADDAPQKIRHWVDLKLSGLRLFTAGSTMVGQAEWLGDPKSYPGWDVAAEIGIPVCVQMRPQGLPKLLSLIARYPKLPIIVDHFMSVDPGHAQPLFELARFPNVFLKFTPVVTKNMRESSFPDVAFLPRVIREFGASRIAWGSNFPASGASLAGLLDDCRQALHGTSPADLEWIFCKTSETLYPALRG